MATDNVLPLNRFLSFTRRRGWLPQIAAGAVLLLIVGGFVLNSYLSSRYGPEGTAVSYVQAIASGDTATAWSLMTVAGGPAPAGTADLATQAGLGGWLHLDPARTGVTKVSVSSHRDVPGGIQVTISYQVQGKTASSQLDLVEDPTANHFWIYPTWRVVVVPSVVTIKSPGVPYGVDGNLVPAKTRAVRVLPGRHVIATSPTELFGPYATTVDVKGGQPGTAGLAPKLSSAAAPGVSGVITQAFQACLANPYSGACPTAFVSALGSWQLIGDPGADVMVTVDSEGRPIATGHYLATVQQPLTNGRADIAVGGGYSAVLSQSGSTFKVESLRGSTSVAALVRPMAVTDSAVQQVVQTALAACIAATQPRPDNCPQALGPGLGSPSTTVRWTWTSDPIVGAKVAFDDQTGIFRVTGHYNANGTFIQSLLGATSNYTSRSSGAYEADVIDDSGTLRVVTIQG